MVMDETWNELGELYTTIGGRKELAMWLATGDSMDVDEALEEFGLEEAFLEEQLEDYREGVVGKEHGGRVLVREGDGDYALTEFGEAWNSRVGSSMAFMLANPHVPVEMDDDEERAVNNHVRDAGEIFSILGHDSRGQVREQSGAKILHLLGSNMGTESIREEGRLRPETGNREVADVIDRLYNNGFIADESYESGSFTWDEEALTERGQAVYDEVVWADYRWLKQYGEEQV
jgi:hypothetical protein